MAFLVARHVRALRSISSMGTLSITIYLCWEANSAVCLPSQTGILSPSESPFSSFSPASRSCSRVADQSSYLSELTVSYQVWPLFSFLITTDTDT
jgi:hypothetical protein